MSDDIKKLMEQFKRIDAEMGGKNTPKDDEATRLQEYRNIVEGRISAFNEQKRVNEQKAQWDSKFGFFQSLDEGKKKEKIGDESAMSEDDCEPGDDFVDGIEEARDFLDVSKSGAMQKVKQQVEQFLVDKGCTNEHWGKPNYSNRNLVFQHPTIKQLAIGAYCMDWTDGKLVPEISMFWNSIGTGDVWIVGYSARDLEDAYAKLLAKAATMHPEDYLY